MASLIIDLVGLTGFAAVCGGVYLAFGLPWALMMAGVMLITWAIKKSKVVTA